MPQKPRVKEAIDRFVARVRHNIDVHLEALATDLAKAFEGDGAAGAEAQRALAELARLAGRQDATEPRGDGLARLVAAMRLLDEAATLRGILDAFARGAGSEATCVSVLLLDGDTLRSFSEFGFAGSRRPVDLPVDSFAVLARVATDRQRVVIQPADSGLPAFMRPGAGHTALAIPLQVGGRVVAVVFAEGPDRSSAAGAASAWSEHVEILVRHASSRLENITSRRTVEVLTTSA